MADCDQNEEGSSILGYGLFKNGGSSIRQENSRVEAEGFADSLTKFITSDINCESAVATNF